MGTATPNANHNTAYSWNSAGRFLKVEAGLWTPTTLGGYTTVGEANPFTFSTKPFMVLFQPLMVLTGPTTVGYGVDYRWDYNNATIRAILGSTATTAYAGGSVGGGVEATTTYASATTAAIPYIAFSW